jgi:hypothetical protein
MSGARIDMFSLDSSTEHSATQISIFSSYRFPNIDVTNPTLPKKNTRIDLDQDRRSPDFYWSFLKPSREDPGGTAE